MALKDDWKDLEDAIAGEPDSGSEITVKPINDIAHSVIENEEKIKELENRETEITIDVEMSDISENPVQNKVIKAYVDEKIGTGGTESNCGIKYRSLELTSDDVDAFNLPKAQILYSYSQYPNGVYLLKWDYGVNPRYGLFIRDEFEAVRKAYLYCDGLAYRCEEYWDDGMKEPTFGDWEQVSYSKIEIDVKFGDVESALDELHNYAQALAGGAK